MIISGNNGHLPQQSSGFWGKFKPKPKEPEPAPPAQMAVARQRLLTLVFGDMETIRIVSIVRLS